ncbi:MAG: TOBE domain-containing protein [Thermomicrobiales bacterium]
MKTSARNQFKGTVTSLKLGGVMADVTIDIGNGQQMSAVITRESAESLGLAEGKEVIAMVKATEVIVATDE